MRKTVLCLMGISAFFVSGLASEHKITVREALEKAAVIAYPEAGRPVDKTVAYALREILPGTEVTALKPGSDLKKPAISAPK